MRVFSKVCLFTLTAMLIAFCGSLVNSTYYEKVSVHEVLTEAQAELKIFQANFNPDLKTIVVIGRSTSMYSYDGGSENPNRYGFIDMLKNKSNVLNLSSISLFNISQAKELLDFARKNTTHIDLVVLENLYYMREMDVFEGYNYTHVLEICAKDNLLSFFNSTPLQLQNVRMCRGLLEGNFEEHHFIKNPCIKKHQEALKTSMLKLKEDRFKAISRTLKCDRSEEVQLYLAKMFYHEFFGELRLGFINAGRDVGVLEKEYLEDYTTDEMVLINTYAKDMFKDAPEDVLLVPAFSRIVQNLGRLSIFHQEKGQFKLLDVASEISTIRHQKNLGFGDVFRDGSHSERWVHELIANQISELYLDKKEGK